jgi:hypothetical protein
VTRGSWGDVLPVSSPVESASPMCAETSKRQYRTRAIDSDDLIGESHWCMKEESHLHVESSWPIPIGIDLARSRSAGGEPETRRSRSNISVEMGAHYGRHRAAPDHGRP